MIIDCHTHIGETASTPEALLASMDQAGIDFAIVLAQRASGEAATIENILKITQKYSRLKAVVDCHYGALDAHQQSQIITLLANQSVVGVKFYLGYESYYANDEKLFPIYEYCQTNNKPVIFHTGILESGEGGLLKYAHPLTIDEVAHLYPDLQIIMAHMGNPWLLDCAAVMAKNKNVYADMSGFFEENSPIREDDVVVFKERMLDAELFLGSYEKFLFGTDWPLYNQKVYVAAIKTLHLTPEEKDLVFWKNAANIFNLKI